MNPVRLGRHRRTRTAVMVATIAVLTLIVGSIVNPIGPASVPAAANSGPEHTTDSSIVVTPSGAVAAGTALSVKVEVSGPALPASGGSVTLYLGDVLVGAAELDTLGVATFSIASNSVVAGSLALSAEYSGSDPWSASTATSFVTVYFPDYPPSRIPGVMQPFYQDIRWLIGQGVAGGYSDGTFRPTAPVTRQAMAAFLFRAANPGAAKPLCVSPPFSDVPVDHRFCGEIRWLADRGISEGYRDGTFRPAVAISRGAMAIFLHRLETGESRAPDCTSAPFWDVKITDAACGAVTWLVSRKITGGYSDGSFRLTASVSRQAMAAFLHRLFGDSLSVLNDGTVELEADDIHEYSGDPASSIDITLKDGVEGPIVGGVLVMPLGTIGDQGIVGEVRARYAVGDRVGLTVVPTTLDAAYESLRTISSTTILPTIAPASARTFAAAPGLTCDATIRTGVEFSTDLLAMTADFDLDIGLFHAPRMSLDLNYRPSATVTLEGALDGECSGSFIAATIPLSVTPPILGVVEPFVTLSIYTTASLSFTVGANIRYEMHSEGTDVDDNFRNDGFTDLEDAEVDGSVALTAGVRASALLGGVTGLSAELGLEAHIGRYMENEQDCFAVRLGLIANLYATLEAWVTDFNVSLASGSLPEKTLVKKCYGGPRVWVGTVEELTEYQASETYSFGSFSTTTSSFSTLWTRDPDNPTFVHSGTRVSSGYTLGQGFCSGTTTSRGRAVSQSEWPRWPDFENPEDPSSFVIYPGAHMEGYTQETATLACEDPQHDRTYDFRGIFHSSRMDSLYGNRAVGCSGRGFPRDIQAILTELTVTCEWDFTLGESGNLDHFVGNVTTRFIWRLKNVSCDTRVDSDGDGMGDCEEFDLGRDTTQP